MNPYFDRGKLHHRPDGFQNVDPAAHMPRPLHELLLWRWQRLFTRIPPAQTDLSPVAPELDFIRANRSAFAVTWIGHATTLVQLAGVNLLTDPVFSKRASPLSWIGPKRRQAPGLRLRDLPPIDVVLISHSHYDHLDRASVLALARQAGGPPLYVVPLGIERWLRDEGITNARALDWWDCVESHGLMIHLTPLQHWSGRGRGDTMKTLWGGFVVESMAPRRCVFFGGDTGWSAQHFGDIGRRFAPIDLAITPIGAYEPRWFMEKMHVNPFEAVLIHRAIGAHASLGVHWGTFEMTDEGIDQPLRDLEAARRAQGLTEAQFRTLRHGQTWRLDLP